MSTTLPIVSEDEVTLYKEGQYVTEISDLRWSGWHSAISFKGKELRRGDLQRDSENDIIGARFVSADGTLSLMVYND